MQPEHVRACGVLRVGVPLFLYAAAAPLAEDFEPADEALTLRAAVAEALSEAQGWT